MQERPSADASRTSGASASAYRPIADYALIGDCHGSALVSSDGRIDWCCLRRFDADPTFFRLLDADRGGFWDITVEGATSVSRAYIDGTNVLRTVFEAASGVLAVTDFMPVGRSRDAKVHDYVTLNAPGWLVRRFECVSGRIRLWTRFSPRAPGFCLDRMDLCLDEDGVVRAGELSLWVGGKTEICEDGDAVFAIELAEGEVETAVLAHVEPLKDPRLHADRLLDVTLAFWREWIQYSRYHGRYHAVVIRSALTLKLLTFAPTGALVAAPTTSLPEQIGGERNWDYRFCWLRDSSLTLYALGVLGFTEEARRFVDFLTQRCVREGAAPNIMYTIDGNSFLPEQSLDELHGYQGSRPVRVGNGASGQRQLDIYGEILDLAHMRKTLGWRLRRDEMSFLSTAASYVTRIWKRPDHGLWEARTAPMGYIHGKAMAWAALDRAIRMFGEQDGWAAARDEILKELTEEGVAGSPPHLVQAFGGEDVDAALLQALQLGLPLDPALCDATVRAVERDLRNGDIVHRYKSEDGLDGSEGAFLITSFWLVDALLLTDRYEEAVALFERLLKLANDVGLYPEEIDPHDNTFLGNFPQAFTHLALISSATLIKLFEMGGVEKLRGSQADRALRLVGSTEGFKSFFASLLRNRSIRLRSSRRSVMDLM